MTTAYNLQAWSKTANSNNGADAGIGTLADGSFPNTVDNWWRGDMAAVARWADDIGGGLKAGGTANAITVATNQGLDSGHLADGLMLVVKATVPNTSASVTFAPDGHTARAVKTADGSALSAGQIKAGAPLVLVYRASGTPEWRCINLQAAGADLGASTSSFQVHKNGVDQGIGTGTTKIGWNIEQFDVGTGFSNNAWMPPAGKVLINLQATVAVRDVDIPVTLALYKGTSAFAKATVVPHEINVNLDGANYAESSAKIVVITEASGSEAFSVYATISTSRDAYIVGKTNKTWFSGTMV